MQASNPPPGLIFERVLFPTRRCPNLYHTLNRSIYISPCLREKGLPLQIVQNKAHSRRNTQAVSRPPCPLIPPPPGRYQTHRVPAECRTLHGRLLPRLFCTCARLSDHTPYVYCFCTFIFSMMWRTSAND